MDYLVDIIERLLPSARDAKLLGAALEKVILC
jgi:hypothetical protein